MGNSQDPITLHKYLYANVDPVGMTDPSGNFATMGELMASMSNAFGSSLSTAMLRRMVKRVVTQTLRDAASIKRYVEKCRRNRNACDIDAPILVVGGDRAAMAEHIREAQTANGEALNLAPSGFLHSWNSRKKTKWYRSEDGCTSKDLSKAVTRYGPKVDCDEFPMNSMDLGGKSNYPQFVSLRYVPAGQNRSIGKMWELMANASRMKSKPNKKAVVVAWEKIPLSFWLPDK